MSKQILGAFLATAGMVIFMPSVHAQLYGASASQNQLYKLDMETAAAITTMTVAVPNQTVTGIDAVTIDPTTNIAYAVVTSSSAPGRLLISVDLPTAVGTEIGTLGDDVASLAFRADGQLFGVTDAGAIVPETLYLIDKTNAAITMAVALGSGTENGVIAFNPHDTAFYHWFGGAPVVYEKVESDTPYAVTGIPINGTTSGETSGAVWDECRSLFLTSNVGSQFATFTTDGTVSPPFGTGPDVIRGLALVGPNTCDVDLTASFDVTPPNPLPISAVTFTAQIVNTGPARALSPVLSFTFPPSITSSATTGCAEDPDGVPTCTLPTLFAGDSASVTIDATYSGGDTEIATVMAATASHDTVTTNNTAAVTLGDTIFIDSFECETGCIP
ncbi:MAG: hypothetical protein ABIQ70_12195 [Dokdonella sp.]